MDMKTLLLILFSIFCIKNDTSKLIGVSPIMPEYPAGIKALRNETQDYVENKRNSYYVQDKIGGSVVTRFEVCKDGSIGDVIIIRSFEKCEGCDHIAYLAIHSLSEQFSPAIGLFSGEAEDCWYTLPIVFRNEHY